MNTNNTNQVSLRRVSLLASVISMLAIFLSAAWAQKALSIIEQPASQTNLACDNATLSVAVSGAGPFTYQWRFNGTNLPTLITTVAGDGVGDDNPATNAMLGPYGVAVDAAGNLFIADSYNNRIRKVDLNGIITTVAGGGSHGSSGYSGDGGAAINAELYSPYGVAVDASGNLFIADSGNNRIRKVSIATGTTLPTLTLDNVSAGNAGDYQVIITSPYGSVTSAVAALTVLLPPSSQNPGMVMSAPIKADNHLLLGFSLSQTSSASLLQLLQASTITGPWTTNTGAVLTTNTQTGGYEFSVPIPDSVEFFKLGSP